MLRRWVLAACVLMSCGIGLGAEIRVEQLDGTTRTPEAVRFREQALEYQTPEGWQTLAIEDLSRVTFAEASAPGAASGTAMVETIRGERWSVEQIRLSDGQVVVKTSTLGELRVSMNRLRVVLLPDAVQTPDAILEGCTEREYGPGSRDLLVLIRPDGTWQSVSGVLKEIGAESVIFGYRGEDRSVSRKALRAIWLADLADPAEKNPGRGVLTTRDGSTLHFSSIRIDGDAVTVEAPTVGTITIARDKLAAIRFFSDRVVRLTKIEPKEVREFGLFDTTFPWQKNRAVSGNPIRLDGRLYTHGLGLHSFCELTYELDGQYRYFVTLAGIDDGVRPRGDAELTILGDGKELVPPMRLRGTEDPQKLRVDVTGVKRLTLRIGFGADKLDVSDHVSLADARLIK